MVVFGGIEACAIGKTCVDDDGLDREEPAEDVPAVPLPLFCTKMRCCGWQIRIAGDGGRDVCGDGHSDTDVRVDMLDIEARELTRGRRLTGASVVQCGLCRGDLF